MYVHVTVYSRKTYVHTCDCVHAGRHMYVHVTVYMQEDICTHMQTQSSIGTTLRAETQTTRPR